MNNALITFVQGDNYVESIDSEIFLTSLSKFKSFKKVVLTKDISDKNLDYLSKYFDEVVPVTNPIMNGARDRFMSYYLWLNNNLDKYDYVMHVDFRDVIIQKNPFEFMLSHPEKDLFVCSEGMKEKESNWNTNDLLYYHSFLQYHRDNFNDYYVLNGGTIGGKPFALSQIFLMLWTNSNRISRSNTDQATLNYLYPYFKSNPKIMVCHPYEDNFCATGEGIKWGNVSVTFDGKNVCNLNNEPYFIYHQWDRTVMAEEIRNNHKNTLSFVV